MDDTAYGKRNKKGDWAPGAYLQTSGLFQWPPRPRALLQWVKRSR